LLQKNDEQVIEDCKTNKRS